MIITTMEAALGIAVLCAAGALSVLVPWLRRRRELSILAVREPLDDESIYAQFYAASDYSKNSVLEVWHEVADTLKVPYAKLRPGDRFGTDVGTHWIISDRLDALAARGQARAKKQGILVDSRSFLTVDDYVRRFSKVKAG